MSNLEPSIALTTCETALREIMTFAYRERFEENWLEQVTSEPQRQAWSQRAQEEAASRFPRGVAEVPSAGLSYANFYDLVAIADANWEPLAPVFGQRNLFIPLLKRFDSLRNAVGHSRPLLPFEQDLLSGIAGQIRNQVTIFMSDRDEVGDIYPRIESVTDSFGRRIESSIAEGEVAGSVPTYEVAVRPGETVTFTCVGIDPQNRDLQWDLGGPGPGGGTSIVSPSGVPTQISYLIQDGDVTETGVLQIYMRAHEAKYHRFGYFDQRAYFMYRIRPPLD